MAAMPEADMVVSARKAEAWAFPPPLQACWRERQCVSPTSADLSCSGRPSCQGKFARQATPQSCRLIPNIMRFFNVLQGTRSKYQKIIITASGGPFYKKKMEDLAKITPKDALAHPTWKMGQKISIDSSTMMNKALEPIEAVQLFGVDKGED